jgi:hypothetical protein
MARLYANENFPLPVVMELRRLGHDVLTVRDSGKANRAVPDSEILEFARVEKRAVLTLNREHFVALHALMPITPASWCARSTRTSPVKRNESTSRWFSTPISQDPSCA